MEFYGIGGYFIENRNRYYAAVFSFFWNMEPKRR